MKHTTIPLEELKKLKKPVNANVKHKENLSLLDKVAVFITSVVARCGARLLLPYWLLFLCQMR